ncbi:MAG: Uncharacterised protein [Marinobacterium sp. xm-d-530]|nr:MAG: Uncharacterised protein [Marinobacterium sp. xm-d-530]
MLRVSRLFLIHIDGNQIKMNGGTLLEINQNIEKRVGILTTGETDHYLIALLDHVEGLYRLPHFTSESFMQLIEAKLLLTIKLILLGFVFHGLSGLNNVWS